MKKIKEFKMSLMQKDDITQEKNEKINKSRFIIKCTACLNILEFLQSNNKYKEYYENNYDDFIFESVSIVYDNLLIHKNKETKIDSIGLWITFEDGQIIDNSISILLLDDIKTYGDKDVIPIIEFFKMTVD